MYPYLIDVQTLQAHATLHKKRLEAAGFYDLKICLFDGCILLQGLYQSAQHSRVPFICRIALIIQDNICHIVFYDNRLYGSALAATMLQDLCHTRILQAISCVQSNVWHMHLEPAEHNQVLQVSVSQNKILIGVDIACSDIAKAPQQAQSVMHAMQLLQHADDALRHACFSDAYNMFQQAQHHDATHELAMICMLQIGIVCSAYTTATTALVDDLLQQIHISHTLRVQAYLTKAAIQQQHGNALAAAKTYEAIANLAEEKKDRWDMIAACMAAGEALALHDMQHALVFFNRAANNTYQLPQLMQRLFDLRLATGDYTGAIDAAERLLRISTEADSIARTHVHMGLIDAHHLQHATRAKYHFQQALKHAPSGDAAEDAWLGLIDMHLSRSDTQQLQAYLQHVTDIAKRHQTKYRIAQYQSQIGHIDVASALYYELINIEETLDDIETWSQKVHIAILSTCALVNIGEQENDAILQMLDRTACLALSAPLVDTHALHVFTQHLETYHCYWQQLRLLDLLAAYPGNTTIYQRDIWLQASHVALHHLQDIPTAITYLEKIIAYHPGDAVALQQLIDLLERYDGNQDKLIVAYQALACATDNMQVRAHALLSQAYLLYKKKEYHQTIMVNLQEVVSLAPHLSDAWELLADLLHGQNNIDKATYYLLEGLKYVQDDTHKHVIFYEKLANLAHKQHNIHNEACYLQHAIDAGCKDIRRAARLIDILYLLEQFNTADKYLCLFAVQYEDKFYIAETWLWRLFKVKKVLSQYDHAASACTHLLEKHKNSEHAQEAHAFLADYFLQIYDFELSLEHGLCVLRQTNILLDTETVHQQFIQTTAIARILQPQIVASLEYAFIKHCPEKSLHDIALSIDTIMGQRGQWLGLLALREYQLEHSPINKQQALHLDIAALLHQHLGRFDEAIVHYEHVCSNHPDDLQTSLLLANLYKQQGDIAQAQSTMQRLLLCNNIAYQNPNLHTTLCDLGMHDALCLVYAEVCEQAFSDSISEYIDDLPIAHIFEELCTLLCNNQHHIPRARSWAERLCAAAPWADTPWRMLLHIAETCNNQHEIEKTLQAWAKQRTGMARIAILQQLDSPTCHTTTRLQACCELMRLGVDSAIASIDAMITQQPNFLSHMQEAFDTTNNMVDVLDILQRCANVSKNHAWLYIATAADIAKQCPDNVWQKIAFDLYCQILQSPAYAISEHVQEAWHFCVTYACNNPLSDTSIAILYASLDAYPNPRAIDTLIRWHLQQHAPHTAWDLLQRFEVCIDNNDDLLAYGVSIAEHTNNHHKIIQWLIKRFPDAPNVAIYRLQDGRATADKQALLGLLTHCLLVASHATSDMRVQWHLEAASLCEDLQQYQQASKHRLGAADIYLQHQQYTHDTLLLLLQAYKLQLKIDPDETYVQPIAARVIQSASLMDALVVNVSQASGEDYLIALQLLISSCMAQGYLHWAQSLYEAYFAHVHFEPHVQMLQKLEALYVHMQIPTQLIPIYSYFADAAYHEHHRATWLYHLGRIYMTYCHNMQHAAMYFAQSLAINPHQQSTQKAYGRALNHLNYFTESAYMLQHILKEDNPTLDDLLLLFDSMYRTATTQVAFDVADAIITRDPQQYTVRIQRASMHEQTGNIKAALVDWQYCHEHQYEATSSCVHIARLYLKLSNTHQAICYLQKIDIINCNEPNLVQDIWHMHQHINIQTDHIPTLLLTTERILQQNPNHPWDTYFLTNVAQAYLHIDHDRSMHFMQKACILS